MHDARDAHGFISYQDKYLIAVGSWHSDSGAKAEIYDIKNNEWHRMPQMNEGTCAPGLIVIGEQYLYKLGGTTDIGKIEKLDLKKI